MAVVWILTEIVYLGFHERNLGFHERPLHVVGIWVGAKQLVQLPQSKQSVPRWMGCRVNIETALTGMQYNYIKVAFHFCCHDKDYFLQSIASSLKSAY